MIRKKSGLNIIMPLELGMVITPEFLLFLLSAKILFPAKKSSQNPVFNASSN